MLALGASKGIFSIPVFMNPGRSLLMVSYLAHPNSSDIFATDTIQGVGKDREQQPQPPYSTLADASGKNKNHMDNHPTAQTLL